MSTDRRNDGSNITGQGINSQHARKSTTVVTAASASPSGQNAAVSGTNESSLAHKSSSSAGVSSKSSIPRPRDGDGRFVPPPAIKHVTGRKVTNMAPPPPPPSLPVQHAPVRSPLRITTQQGAFNKRVGASRKARASFPINSTAPAQRAHNFYFMNAGPETTTTVYDNFSSQGSTSGHHRHSMISHMAPSTSLPIQMPTKSSNPIVPMWQMEDEVYEKLHPNKRRRQEENIGNEFTRRISITSNPARYSTGRPTTAPRRSEPSSQASNGAYLGRGLSLRAQNNSDDSDMDQDTPPAQRGSQSVYRKVAANNRQVGMKRSARKVEMQTPDSSDESTSSPGSSNEEEQVDELFSDHEIPTSDDEEGQRMSALKVEDQDVDMDTPQRRTRSPPEIIVLDSPPEITISLPQIAPELAPPPAPSEPSDELLAAMESLTLSSVLMRHHRQLPFRRKNLRAGFEHRCRALNIPTTASTSVISVLVRYEYLEHACYEAHISEWLCPLCDLHDTFKNRDMLAAHLGWDHQEVFVEWNELTDSKGATTWKVILLIPETQEEEISPDMQHGTQEGTKPAEQPVSAIKNDHDGSDGSSTPTRPLFSSPFPFVALSPSSEPASALRLTTISSHATQESPISPELKRPEHPEVPSPSTSVSRMDRRQSYQSSSYRQTSSQIGRSATTQTTTSISTFRALLADDTELVLPPEDDPLGPAARYPYLPATSDYGGPTVYYSCRPGGQCLFDLLGTLPMDQFGVLDWAVLDREEEIYESDDVKEEFKVMHALWARWIMLHKNTFMKDYYKGTIAFVDEYWKMIHRAAGWDALRYWLLMLLGNRFLTGREMAMVLKHYESHTGMDNWY
ncbi:hypothetical protein BDQ12DRAFT_678115 [Crucibulum laeve]|uniref:Uncharacterized protein n=1 Tax=Crucibulum laeve TaxID=68775 RepID=A0A5C3MAL8_9AGAR|nr:hypothetical protein BDQ12DRAFT_678115 [Crucibulum laeve]